MATRRLYRSRNGEILGVCKGIAEWRDYPVDTPRGVASPRVGCLVCLCVCICVYVWALFLVALLQCLAIMSSIYSFIYIINKQ